MKDSAVVSRIVHESCERAAPLMPSGHWWEHLQDDFARTPEKFDLARADRAADRRRRRHSTTLVRAAFGTMVARHRHPLRLQPEVSSAARCRASHLYAEMAESGDANALLPRAADPACSRAHHPRPMASSRFQPDDGVCEVVRFDSPFQPLHPAAAQVATFATSRNRVAYARHHPPPRRAPDPTIVAIHGFTAEGYLINEWFFALPWFYRMGCDIALFTLPFHGPAPDPLLRVLRPWLLRGGHIPLQRGRRAVGLRLPHTPQLAPGRSRAPSRSASRASASGGFISVHARERRDRKPGLRASQRAHHQRRGPRPRVAADGRPHACRPRGRSDLTPADARRLVAVSCPLTYPPVLPPRAAR